MVMTDLEKAIEAYEETQKGPRSYLQETIDAADELAKAARAYIAAEELSGDLVDEWNKLDDDDAANNEDGLSAEAFGRLETPPASPWTPVEDGLPKVGQRLWVTVKVGDGPDGKPTTSAAAGHLSSDCWRWGNGTAIAYEVIAWMPAPDPYQPPTPVDPLAVAVEALEKIASRHVTKDPLWWQRAAREALEQVQGEE